MTAVGPKGSSDGENSFMYGHDIKTVLSVFLNLSSSSLSESGRGQENSGISGTDMLDTILEM